MSGVQPFQFEPTYPPGKEPVDSEEETGDEGDSGANFDNRVGNTEWCICGGNCRRPMNVFVVKNWRHLIKSSTSRGLNA